MNYTKTIFLLLTVIILTSACEKEESNTHRKSLSGTKWVANLIEEIHGYDTGILTLHFTGSKSLTITSKRDEYDISVLKENYTYDARTGSGEIIHYADKDDEDDDDVLFPFRVKGDVLMLFTLPSGEPGIHTIHFDRIK